MASQKDLEAPVEAAHTSSQQSFNLTELPRVGQNKTTDKQVERITNDLALLQAIDKPPMPRQDDLFEHKRRQARVRDARRNGARLVLVSGMNAQEAEEYNRAVAQKEQELLEPNPLYIRRKNALKGGPPLSSREEREYFTLIRRVRLRACAHVSKERGIEWRREFQASRSI
ncbi:hypothetical protein MCOR07_005316 [Pyricularia oryzae]|uniref:Uncharacterized protein n=1 Tax=Pyricularia grisea TaxID=148305 RepID=A0ABQ8NNY1_PYRGI|nr:hypothetical protein MCOR01_009030 [Pyricularia oryzae]KAI6299987.1 hypothetical protein MCOR33_004195 [Pyricularia grisea]KAI6323838.1 hypothetical protein MCOR29_004284 [Pyricularia oryzae]KAI6331203.1 hypothetical protein MCOR30_004898 [Pyricularia oryzae]KAI6335094.1 hypothetical protein MCOR28_009800 [Pyricularia oryzae]